MTQTTNADVVVVGAGFAGLTAARELVRLGRDVVVLEGRDRVGGRSSTTTIAGVPVDLGGTFVGPTQDAVIELARELGCETVPTHARGKNLIRWRGRVRSYRSTIPKLSIIELVDVGRIQWRFERVSRRVPVAEPWTSPIAEILDSKTLEEWLRYVHASASTRDLMAIMSRVTWGCEPDEVSMLHAVRYVKAAGGLGRMLDVEGGAQQDRFPGGTQQIALQLAEELGSTGQARRDRAAHRPQRRRHLHRQLRWRRRHRKGRRRRDPAGAPREDRLRPGPARRVRKLAQHWPQGNLSKAYAAYETPFWRADGCSGEALSDEGPVFITFDVSPDDDGPGVLLGFTDRAHVRPAATGRTPRARAGRVRRPVRRRRR